MSESVIWRPPFMAAAGIVKVGNKDQEKKFDSDSAFQTPGDVVFICENGKLVECHLEVLLSISSTMRDILRHDKIFNSYFVPKDFKIYINVNFSESLLSSFMNSIYFKSSLSISKKQIKELFELMRSLGISDNLIEISDDAHTTNDLDEDAAIVNIISSLIDDFKTSPAQAERSMTEMLMTSIDENFINDMNENTDKDAVNFSFETVLTEPSDGVVKGVQDELLDEQVTENPRIQLKKKRKMRPTRPKIRDCGVKLENLSNKTLSHYYEIFLKKKYSGTGSNSEAPENDEDSSKKKRKINHDSENEVLKKNVVNEASSIVGFPEESQYSIEAMKKDTEPESTDDRSLSSIGKIEKPDHEIQEVDVVTKHQVKCEYCELKFNNRSRLLQHLCVTHYTLKILELYPFTKTECTICQEQGRLKPFFAKQKAAHLCHVGQAHEVIMDIIPESFKNIINKEFKKRIRKTKIKEEPLDDSVVSLHSQDSFPNNSNSTESFQNSFAQFMTNVSEPVQSTPLPRREKKVREMVYQDEDANMYTPTPLIPKEPAPQSTDENISAPTKLMCSLCDVTDMVTFNFRSEMLKHLSEVHLAKQLLTLYPMPPSKQCSFCILNGKVETFSDDNLFVDHIGRYHEKVLEILPSDFCDRIEAMPRSNENDLAQFEVIHSDDSFNVSFESSLNSTHNDDSSNEALNSTIIGQNDNGPCLDESNSESQDKIAKFVELSNIVASKTTDDDNELKVWKCKHCEEVFLNAEERMHHIQIKHGKKRAKNYSCRYCESHFNDPKQFKLHLIAHKKDLIVQ